MVRRAHPGHAAYGRRSSTRACGCDRCLGKWNGAITSEETRSCATHCEPTVVRPDEILDGWRRGKPRIRCRAGQPSRVGVPPPVRVRLQASLRGPALRRVPWRDRLLRRQGSQHNSGRATLGLSPVSRSSRTSKSPVVSTPSTAHTRTLGKIVPTAGRRNRRPLPDHESVTPVVTSVPRIRSRSAFEGFLCNYVPM
jgi:hypothetical protein